MTKAGKAAPYLDLPDLTKDLTNLTKSFVRTEFLGYDHRGSILGAIMDIHWDAESQMLVIQSEDIPVRTKPRPRATKWGVHMPREYQEWKSLIRQAIDTTIEERYSKKQTLFGKEPVSMWLLVAATRGDADNAAGGIMDAFTGSVWNDDRQVMELHIWKVPKKQLGYHWKCRVMPKIATFDDIGQ
ncbi:MAG: RusA family crossover junction endodeoxyribonuclease [Prochlorotrichaceae cyanobacterium]